MSFPVALAQDPLAGVTLAAYAIQGTERFSDLECHPDTTTSTAVAALSAFSLEPTLSADAREESRGRPGIFAEISENLQDCLV